MEKKKAILNVSDAVATGLGLQQADAQTEATVFSTPVLTGVGRCTGDVINQIHWGYSHV